MMNLFAGHILKLGLLMKDLFVSAAGCFALMHCFYLIATIGKERSETGSSHCFVSPFRKPMAGIGTALFSPAFVTSEP
ncbi:MAG: hypothetical protein ABSC48_14500 [Terracidiphilus sp.]|jgi:hypothetical protein